MSKRKEVSPAVQVDPELEKRWQAAFRTYPASGDLEALAAWNDEHEELVTTYQTAVSAARAQQASHHESRRRQRRQLWVKAGAGLAAVAAAVSGIVWWANQPSEDEDRLKARLAREAACDVQFEQAHHLRLVTRQIDLLADGEAGWLRSRQLPDEPQSVGNIDLYPVDLRAGKTSQAKVNRESFVYDDMSYDGPRWMLLERRGSELILTLFYREEGFYGDLRHDPLATPKGVPVTVQGRLMSDYCWW